MECQTRRGRPLKKRKEEGRNTLGGRVERKKQIFGRVRTNGRGTEGKCHGKMLSTKLGLLKKKTEKGCGRAIPTKHRNGGKSDGSISENRGGKGKKRLFGGGRKGGGRQWGGGTPNGEFLPKRTH